MELPPGIPELPPGIADVLTEFADQMRTAAGAIGLYVGGSLASGDYQPGISDMDLVAVVREPLDDGQQQLGSAVIHRKLHRPAPGGGRTALRLRAGRETRRRVRAARRRGPSRKCFPGRSAEWPEPELLGPGFAVFGPPPAGLIPSVSPRRAARGRPAGAVRRPDPGAAPA